MGVISWKEGMVRKVTALLTSLFALLLLQGQVHAWNATGHTVVAFIAWKNLTPATKKAVFGILQKHPDYPAWVQGLPNDDELRGLQAFLQAATWPDSIKSDARFYNDATDPNNRHHLS